MRRKRKGTQNDLAAKEQYTEGDYFLYGKDKRMFYK